MGFDADTKASRDHLISRANTIERSVATNSIHPYDLVTCVQLFVKDYTSVARLDPRIDPVYMAPYTEALVRVVVALFAADGIHDLIVDGSGVGVRVWEGRALAESQRVEDWLDYIGLRVRGYPIHIFGEPRWRRMSVRSAEQYAIHAVDKQVVAIKR